MALRDSDHHESAFLTAISREGASLQSRPWKTSEPPQALNDIAAHLLEREPGLKMTRAPEPRGIRNGASSGSWSHCGRIAERACAEMNRSLTSNASCKGSGTSTRG